MANVLLGKKLCHDFLVTVEKDFMKNTKIQYLLSFLHISEGYYVTGITYSDVAGCR